MKRPVVVPFLVLTYLCLASCTKSYSPAAPRFLTRHVGEPCTVQFRRDALGAGASLPISPTTGSINGATVTQDGMLVAVEGEGIVIELSSPSKATCWIPYRVILSVELTGH